MNRFVRGGISVTRLSRTTALGLAAASLLSPVIAAAQTPSSVPGAATPIAGVTPVYVDKADFKGDSRPEGWASRGNAGLTAAFANNSGVVGQTDGTSFSFGMKGDVSLDYNREKHEWRNTLGVVASITRTPVVAEFVKTSDNLNFDSIYLYHALPWFGPFGLVSMNTAMFRGSDVEAAPVSYVITKTDGTMLTPIVADHLSLSDPFRPLTFKQSAGIFAQAYQSVPATLELRLGAGAQEVLADGQLAVTGTVQVMNPVNGVLNQVNLQQLEDANQLGPELAASLWGTFVDKTITYRINADVMTPALHSALVPGDTRGPVALTNVQVDGKVSFHFVSWASLDYQLRAIRQPQVVDVFQVQNTLLLTFGLSYGSKPPAPPPCVPCTLPAPPPPPPGN
jgi:Protein of unknown function (DUF3078)